MRKEPCHTWCLFRHQGQQGPGCSSACAHGPVHSHLLVYFEGTFCDLEVNRTMPAHCICVLHNVTFSLNWVSTYLHSSQIKVRARVLEVTAGCWILSVSPVSTTSRIQCGHRESVTEDLPGTTWAQPCPRVPQVGLVLQSGSCTSLSVREHQFSHSPLLTIRNAF